jgi:hypothetical protein
MEDPTVRSVQDFVPSCSTVRQISLDTAAARAQEDTDTCNFGSRSAMAAFKKGEKQDSASDTA